MISVPDKLPDDPALLKRLLLESYAARLREQEANQAHIVQIDDLNEQIKLWRDRFFGRKSEQPSIPKRRYWPCSMKRTMTLCWL